VLDIQAWRPPLALACPGRWREDKVSLRHDERHWFVAAVPESAPVGTGRAAKEALKPREVQNIQSRLGLGSKARETAEERGLSRNRGSGSSCPPPS